MSAAQIMKRTLLLITLTTAANSATADQDNLPAPLSIKNQNPFIQIFGLPATQQARVSPPNNETVEVALDIANNSIIHETAGSEEITLDGETYRLSLTLRRGIGDGIEVGAELPLVAHSNGVMDNFIEGWHDAFGLTNNDRNKSTSNTLNYDYRRNGAAVMSFTQPNNGIGDIRLFAANKLSHNSAGALSLHASLKLPTGDAEQLHGSGAPDLALSIAHMRERWLSSLQLSTFLNGGLLFLGESDRFSAIQHRTVAFGSTGVIWDSHSLIDLKAQLDAHSAFYRSDLDQLGSRTLQLTVGGSIHFSPTARLDLGVGENLFTDTTPDFLINIAYKQNY
jgi:hypothetical protein